MNPRDEEILWLAALLHDIGKFRERTFEPLPKWAESYRAEAKYSHEPFSAGFVDAFMNGWAEDNSILRRLVLKHHTPSLRDERLVSLSDRLSAYERAEVEGDEEGARGRAETALRTVLSRVELHGKRAEAPQYYHLTALSLQPDALMPRQEVRGSAEAYRLLWQEFKHELRCVPHGDGTTLLAVLKRFTWAIPSDTRYDMIPDVSLYDHLKTTAAIAVCLAREGLSEDEVTLLDTALTRRFRKEPLSNAENDLLNRPLCALVKGDISGTQEFLYLLTSSGAARGLRGRSFYLQLLTETVAHWTLRQLRLPVSNLLFAGGGHFYLLLPYTQTQGQMEGWRRRITEKLWRAHRGDLSLTVDWVPVAARDFLEGGGGGSAFADKWSEVTRQVNERKQRKWSDLGGEAMLRELFTSHQCGTTAEEMCQVCHGEWKQGVDMVDDDTRKCPRCAQFEELGRFLRDPTHLVLFTVPETEPPDPWDWRGVLRAFGTEAWLVRPGDEVPTKPDHAEVATVETFDSTEFLTEEALNRFHWDDLPVSYGFRLLADATPLKRNEQGGLVIAEFSDLAEASDGVKWLGVLRMDVDSLGDVFKSGLGTQATLSRMSTLSEALRLFFEAYVPHLCHSFNGFGTQTGQGKDSLYLIYAGGDDLFVVGAWSVLPQLARQIRDDFRKYVGGDHVTLSGGIAIEHQKYPLYQLANDAKHALDDRAKEYEREDGRKKDALCFLQTAMGWEQFREVAEWREKLLAALRPQEGRTSLPRSFLTRLGEIYSLYAGNVARTHQMKRLGEVTPERVKEVIAYDKWRWRLVYHLSRFAQRYEAHQPLIEELQQALVKADLIAALHVLARWVQLETREVEG